MTDSLIGKINNLGLLYTSSSLQQDFVDDVYKLVTSSTPPVQEPVSDAWQPIETAPKDGASIMTTCAGVIGCIPAIVEWLCVDGECRWHEDQENFMEESHFREHWEGCRYNPTHWMPLPKPPGAPAATVKPSEIYPYLRPTGRDEADEVLRKAIISWARGNGFTDTINHIHVDGLIKNLRAISPSTGQDASAEEVERVAIALYDAIYSDGEPFSDASEYLKLQSIEFAKVAIKAMRNL